MIQKTIIITENNNGMRIDTLAHETYPKISRSQWGKQGRFFLNGESQPGKTKTKQNDEWKIQYEEKVIVNTLEPWDFPLTVLAESESWVAIYKPIEIPVHPSVSDPAQKTIVNALIHQFKEVALLEEEITDPNIPQRPGLVHRLDKDTSGVLLIAKTKKSHTYFQENWKSVEKLYQAHAVGRTPRKGKIESGIERNPENRQKMQASDNPKSKKATTFFETLETHKNISHLSIRIPTGRTHQIRVHLSSIGFPIIGDTKYGGPESQRLMLHAHSLTFPDPDKKGAMKTVIAPLPEEFNFKS